MGTGGSTVMHNRRSGGASKRGRIHPVFGLAALLLVVGCGTDSQEDVSAPTEGTITTSGAPMERVQPGQTGVVSVDSEEIGTIAVQISLPAEARYSEGAGVVVEVNTFFTAQDGFFESVDVTEIGLIHISYLWPGTTDQSGAYSDGTLDHGGEDSMLALRDVIRFAAGEIPDADGWFLADLIAITPLDVGLYAFSHPGLAAVNVLATHGDDLDVKWLLGRENPTEDVTSAVEIGHWGSGGRPVPAPGYRYPGSYTATALHPDYTGARWDDGFTEAESRHVGRAYLDLDGDGELSDADFVFGSRIPVMFDMRFHSVGLTRALADGGSLTADSWPTDLATVDEAERVWAVLSSVPRYEAVGELNPDLMVMLVFADRDHVQPALDKPHIHMAFDGFSATAGLWVRLNPDRAYVESLAAEFAALASDNPANTEPSNWIDARSWSYGNAAGANQIVPLAAVAEMADRAHGNVMDDDLDRPLVIYAVP